MKRLSHLFGFVALFSLSSITWSQEMSCDQIRNEIQAQSGVLVAANTDLLRKISGRNDCRFTAPEVYRAAYGTKPLPKEEASREHHSHDHDD